MNNWGANLSCAYKCYDNRNVGVYLHFLPGVLVWSNYWTSVACPGIKVIQTYSHQLAPTYLIQSTWLDETINAVIAGLNSSVYVRDLTPRAAHSRRGTTSKCACVPKYSTAQDAQMCTDVEEGDDVCDHHPFFSRKAQKKEDILLWEQQSKSSMEQQWSQKEETERKEN